MVKFKTLGPVSANLIATLKEEKRDIFGISDAQRITGLSTNATTDLLSKMVKRKVILRLKPGKYLILPLEAGRDTFYMANWYVIARELIRPHPYFISYYSALDIHNMVTQPIQKIYISTPIRRQKCEIGGGEFRFVYTPRKKLWGITKEWVTPQEQVRVSDIERTVIDCFYNPKLCGGISEIAKGIWLVKEEIDYRKLLGYVLRFNKKVVAQRLGFILEVYQLGSKRIVASLQNYIAQSKSYALFDPALLNQGRYQKRWRLRINVEPEELKSIVRT